MVRILRALLKSCVVSLAVLAIWYALEWQQFGELQWNRVCDEAVFWLYFVVLLYLFLKGGETHG